MVPADSDVARVQEMEGNSLYMMCRSVECENTEKQEEIIEKSAPYKITEIGRKITAKPYNWVYYTVKRTERNQLGCELVSNGRQILMIIWSKKKRKPNFFVVFLRVGLVSSAVSSSLFALLFSSTGK